MHPLHPGEKPPLFIAEGVLKTPADVAPFFEMPAELVPLLAHGVFTLNACAGNAKSGQRDFIYYQGRRMAGNARGMPNPGIEGIYALRDTIKELNERGIKSMIQIAHLPHEDPAEVIPPLVAAAVEVQPTAVTLDLSCPHSRDEEGNLAPPIAMNPDASGRITRLARNEVGPDVLLGVKDAPHVTALDQSVNEWEIADLSDAITPNIDFVIGINTIGGQSFPEITCTDGVGGMSGPVVAEIAKQHLRLWKQYEPNLTYLSCGGVESGNIETEVPERLALGALLIGGAQQFYRAKDIAGLATIWAMNALHAIDNS